MYILDLVRVSSCRQLAVYLVLSVVVQSHERSRSWTRLEVFKVSDGYRSDYKFKWTSLKTDAVSKSRVRWRIYSRTRDK